MQILTTLLDIVSVFLRLLEAEARVLRRAVMDLWLALALIGIAALLVFAAAGFFLVGIYQYLATQLSPAAASLFMSLVAFLLALVFVGIARWRTADPK